MRRLMTVVLVAVGCACGPDSELVFVGNEDDEGAELAASALTAATLLPFVNSASTTVALLTTDVGVESRAANGIVAARPFISVAALDAVSWVGPATLAKLDAYAAAHPPVALTPTGGGSVTAEGVVFTAQEAAAAISTANGPSLLAVGLFSVPYNNLVAARPFSTLAAIAAVLNVGPGALTLLRTYVQKQLGTPAVPTGTACTATGGTYDGVAFTRDEECRAAEFLAKARLSEMALLPAFARLLAYESGPEGVYSFQSTPWTSLPPFANRSGIGATAMGGLKAASANWKANGLSYDTVAATWTNRASLVNGPLYLDKVWVMKLLPETTAGLGGMECAEVRDNAAAPNYLVACVPSYICDGGPGQCWAVGANTWISGHKTLRRSSIPGSGGYQLTLNVRPHGPNPNVP